MPAVHKNTVAANGMPDINAIMSDNVYNFIQYTKYNQAAFKLYIKWL